VLAKKNPYEFFHKIEYQGEDYERRRLMEREANIKS
jgi:hypothetical protein